MTFIARKSLPRKVFLELVPLCVRPLEVAYTTVFKLYRTEEVFLITKPTKRYIY